MTVERKVELFSQTASALDYVRRTGAHFSLPLVLMDREARALSDKLDSAGRGGALKGQSPDPPLDGRRA